MSEEQAGELTLQEAERVCVMVETAREAVKKDPEFWRRMLKGRHEVKALLLIIFVRKSGQLAWVKLVPSPPSKGLGRGEVPAVGKVPVPESVPVDEGEFVAEAEADC